MQNLGVNYYILEESIYRCDDDVFFPPFSKNGSQNLISVHFQYSMPYRSIVTHLVLTSRFMRMDTSRRVRSLMMTHCSRACNSVLMIFATPSSLTGFGVGATM